MTPAIPGQLETHAVDLDFFVTRVHSGKAGAGKEP
jgi:hypothetical protein